MAMLCLVIVMIGFIRFAADLWSPASSSATDASVQVNYRGLGAMLTGLGVGGLFLLLYRGRKF